MCYWPGSARDLEERRPRPEAERTTEAMTQPQPGRRTSHHTGVCFVPIWNVGASCDVTWRGGPIARPAAGRVAHLRHLSLLPAPSLHIMAQAAVPPSNDIMSTTSLSKSSAGRTPAANGHYVNGSAATSDASSERIQIIDDEKQFTYAGL